MTWRLRTATVADLEHVMAIETAAFAATAWTRELMAAELASPYGRYVVAVVDEPSGRPIAFPQGDAEPELGGCIVGYAGLRAVGTEGDVQTIAVADAVRGSGLGRALLTEVEAEARRRGVRELFLEVQVDNDPARALYQSVGFVQTGIRPSYYHGVDACSMKKVLA